MSRRIILGSTFALIAIAGSLAWTQSRGRRHTATEAKPLELVPATEEPPSPHQSRIEQEHGHLHIASNGIPKHLVGRFPNRGNPHAIRPQRYAFDLPENPKPAEQTTSIYFTSRFGPPNMPFGVAVNGVLFDPGTAEFWQGDRSSGWNYEALGGAVRLGLDENYAHVQPQGSYHYHGLPHLLLKDLGFDAAKHSPLIGWAADGFPVYCIYGFKDPNAPDSGVTKLRSSFRLRDGERPNGEKNPGGKYDGTFLQDYTFSAGAGDLDECNGRFCKTPDFPMGTYAYFLTEEWPVIPRSFRGVPVRLR
ncbi:MAG: YHYH protein [Planctomycetes bacterium]|nr:YHYH protein [Planctomycetota bacterium]